MVAVVCAPSCDETPPNLIFSLRGYPGILDTKWQFFSSLHSFFNGPFSVSEPIAFNWENMLFVFFFFIALDRPVFPFSESLFFFFFFPIRT